MAELQASVAYSPSRALPAKLARRMTQWRRAAPLPGPPRRPIVSFTFDDFTRSAGDTGAAIVEAAGGHAAFYACTGMAGQVGPCGELFDERDVHALARAGHEIGAHTQSHLDCARASVADALGDIDRNLDVLRDMGLDREVTQFAYPFGETTLALKRRLVGKFSSARGILAGANRAGADRMQLRAFELDASDSSLARAARAIEQALRKPAWVIVFTHDVSEAQSDWGVAPRALQALARQARDGGAAILTPSQALQELGAGSR